MPTAEEYKQRSMRGWTFAAQGWKRYDEFVGGVFFSVAERMLDIARVTNGARVLDLATGTGHLAINAARRLAGTGRVLGTDFVPEMTEFAKHKAQLMGFKNLEFQCSDGEYFELEPAAFDAVVCRFGMMYMPKPEQCAQSAFRSLSSGGRFVTAVFSTADRNPWATRPGASLNGIVELPPSDKTAPGSFALGDPTRLTELIKMAGFGEVSIEPAEVMLSCHSGAAYTEWFSTSTPFGLTVNSLAPDVRERALAAITKALGGDGAVRLPGHAWIASGVKP